MKNKLLKIIIVGILLFSPLIVKAGFFDWVKFLFQKNIIKETIIEKTIEPFGGTVCFPYQGCTGTDTSAWIGLPYVTSGVWATTSEFTLVGLQIQGNATTQNIIPSTTTTYTLGNSEYRWNKLWTQDLDTAGVFTLGGTVASGGLNLNGEKLIFDADATTWMQSTDTEDYIFFVNNNATTTTINNLGYWGYGTSTPALPLSIQASSSSGYFSISNTQDNDIFSIDGSGNVGIGTSSPASLLEVYADAADSQLTITVASTTTNDPILTFRTGTTPATQFVLGVDQSDSNKFKIATSTIGTDDVFVIDQSGRIGISTSSPTFGLEIMASSTDGYFGIGENGQTGNIFLVDETGNVGVGTAAPSGKLHVNGDIYIQGGVDARYKVPVDNSYIQFDADTTGSTVFQLFGKNHATSPGLYRVYTVDSAGTSAIERFRITGKVDTGNIVFSNSNIGIGTTTPQSILQIGTPLDETDSYMQMDVKTDTPPATDCDIDNEAGRFIFLSSSTDAFYVCKGSGGWASTTLP